MAVVLRRSLATVRPSRWRAALRYEILGACRDEGLLSWHEKKIQQPDQNQGNLPSGSFVTAQRLINAEMHPAFLACFDHHSLRHLSSAAAQKRRLPEEDEGSKAAVEVEADDARGTGWSMQEFLTWPNTISLSRLVLGPVLAWVVLQGFPGVAFCGMVIGGLTDWLDGYVARRMKVRSVLGSYLDPLADKVLVGSVALSMTYVGLLHPGLVLLMVTRDAVLVAGALYYRAHSLKWKWNSWGEFFKINVGGAPKLQPIFISKVNTALQLGLISAALLEPSIPELETTVWFLSWSVAGTTLSSWIWYGVLYFRSPQAVLKLNKVVSDIARRASSPKKQS